MQTISNTLFLNTGADSLICIPFYKSEMCPSIFILFFIFLKTQNLIEIFFVVLTFSVRAGWNPLPHPEVAQSWRQRRKGGGGDVRAQALGAPFRSSSVLGGWGPILLSWPYLDSKKENRWNLGSGASLPPPPYPQVGGGIKGSGKRKGQRKQRCQER